MPTEFYVLHRDPILRHVTHKIGINSFWATPGNGVDLERITQLLHTLTQGGQATVKGKDGAPTRIVLIAQVIAEALLLPYGEYNIDTWTNKTDKEKSFKFIPGQEYNYTDLQNPELELALRLFNQHFFLGKAVRHTQPHRGLTHTLNTVWETKKPKPSDVAGHVYKELLKFAAGRGLEETEVYQQSAYPHKDSVLHLGHDRPLAPLDTSECFARAGKVNGRSLQCSETKKDL